jgi:hypothetical protein
MNTNCTSWKHNEVGVLETGDGQFSQQRITGRSSKTRVFLMTVARFYTCGRTTSGRLGHAPTLGIIRIGLNMTHEPMGQNKVSKHRWQKKSLHQNNDYGRLRHDMDLRFDAYESRLQELSRKYLHAWIQVHMWSGWPSQAVAVLESESHRRECNSVSFFSIVPKQQNRIHISIV